MRLKRSTKLLIEPPAVATGDIAFNLIVFFLVCASTVTNAGRKQNIPRSEPQAEKSQQSENIEVTLTRTTAAINGEQVTLPNFQTRLAAKLQNKTRPEDKIVVVKSSKDTSYEQWIKITGWIEELGGVVTMQMEEDQTVTVQ